MFGKNKKNPPTAKAVMADRGFTLVEIMVVVSSVGIIMMITIAIILQTMKAQNRNEALSKLSDEGNRIISELKRNVFNSNGKIICTNGSVEVTSLFDNLNTILSCSVVDDRIASTSGVTKKLNNNDVSLTSDGCDNFAVCLTSQDITGSGDTNVASVVFNFGLKNSVSGVGASQLFSTTVTVRN